MPAVWLPSAPGRPAARRWSGWSSARRRQRSGSRRRRWPGRTPTTSRGRRAPPADVGRDRERSAGSSWWGTNHLLILASSMMQGKVALEEHVVLPTLSAPGVVGSAAGAFEAEYFADVRRRLNDASLMRLEDMDRFGIETMVLSLSQPGVQAIA